MPRYWQYNYTPYERELLRRAEAARVAIRAGADPMLMLSYVIQPTPRMKTLLREDGRRIAA